MRLFGRFIGGVALVVGLGAGAGIALVPLALSPAGAATVITVNDASDTSVPTANCSPGEETDCTLRAALAEAATVSGAVTVSVPDPTGVAHSPASVYQVLSTRLTMATLDASSSVSLEGAGAATSKIQAQCTGVSCTVTFGVIHTDGPGTTAISGVTIEGGHESSNSGGGVWNTGTLTISNSTISNNFSINVGGGIFNAGVLTTQGDTITNNSCSGRGGGVDQEFDTNGSMSLNNDTISNNTDGGNGGGVYIDTGTASLTGETITGNSANPGNGGGVFVNSGANSFSENTIDSNTATSGNGGGIEIDGGTNTFSDNTITNNSVSNGPGPQYGGGAAIFGGTNTFTGDTASNNTATNSNGGAFYLAGGTNIFNGVTVTGNTATWDSQVNEPNGDGGGFFIVSGTNTLTGGSISGNNAYEGGGVFIGVLSLAGPNQSSAPRLTELSPNSFTQETISDNIATEAGGGLSLDSTFFSGITLPSADVTDSTISDNQVGGDVGITSFLGDGGGILANGCTSLTLTNDTITGNVANDGGGYVAVNCFTTPPPGTTAFLFDTVNANTARNPSGAGNLETISGSSSATTAAETIIAGGIAGSAAKNCLFSTGGAFSSGGYNLIDDSTCGTASTDIVGQGAQLGALANNGGPTLTELPASTSPAVSAVPTAACSGTGVSTDQRSQPRGTGQHGSCTIGAVEVAAATPPSFNPNGYRMVAVEGGIFDFGLNFNGSLANNKLNAPIVGIANAPGVNGYVMVGSDGGVFALGGANFYGSLGGQKIPSPIAAIAAPPSETGYWLVAQNGKIYNYGSVPPLPALSLPVGAHIVGMASTTDGMGAWMTDQLGDVYAEGSAQYVGGLGGVHINKPIVGIAAAASGQGYVLVATDGGAFAYGTQKFYGSVPGSLKPGQSLVAPIVGIAVTHSGNGYWEVASDGGVFTYGDAPFLGSIYTALGNHPLNGPIVGIQHLGVAPS